MSIALQADYAQRVYAGVLGKIIGVYLGRPFEGWGYDALTKTFGEISYYVNQHPHYGEKKPPLVVTDDDISGTFTFFRALEDWGYRKDLSAEQVGQCWLNYLLENKTVLWWGGMGLSTEHTAFLRLKHGVKAPASGSIALNGAVVAEQIGAQIFIDAWGLVSPGNVKQAAAFAKVAGSVSHDGEAVYGAQVVAGLVAGAFVENNIDRLIDAAVAEIPPDCLIHRMIAHIRGWVKQDGNWRTTFQRIVAQYGYDKYGGNCHIIPNHALVILALLYAPDSFSEALKIVNTCGWDTDCNSANVGCILGVKLGLEGMQRQHDWRGPVADRMLLPTADGGRTISDAVLEAQAIVKAAHALNGLIDVPEKGGARYSFAYPGSVQGFVPLTNALNCDTAVVENLPWPLDEKQRALAIRVAHVRPGDISGAAVNTFFSPPDFSMGGYGLYGSPVVYAGQTIETELLRQGGTGTVRVRLSAASYGQENKAQPINGDWHELEIGKGTSIVWKVPSTDGNPIYQLALEIAGEARDALVYVKQLAINGMASTALMPTTEKCGDRWKAAWVEGVDRSFQGPIEGSETWGKGALWAVQNEEIGAFTIGTRNWNNYRFTVTARPHVAAAFGVAVAWGGVKKQIRFLIHQDNRATLEHVALSGVRQLAQGTVKFELYKSYEISAVWTDAGVQVRVNGNEIIPVTAVPDAPSGGGVALAVEVGRVKFSAARVEPAR